MLVVRKNHKMTERSIERSKDEFIPTRKFEDTEECRRGLSKTGTNDQWKELCKDIEEEVLEKYGVEENKSGVYKGRVEEPQWSIKKVDYKHAKEGGTREKKPTGEQSWGRLASLLKAFGQRQREASGRGEK